MVEIYDDRSDLNPSWADMQEFRPADTSSLRGREDGSEPVSGRDLGEGTLSPLKC